MNRIIELVALEVEYEGDPRERVRAVLNVGRSEAGRYHGEDTLTFRFPVAVMEQVCEHVNALRAKEKDHDNGV